MMHRPGERRFGSHAVAVPTLGALLGEGEQTRRYDTVITPPDYAFAVWGPIFAGCVASTVGQCLPSGRSRPASRRAGWPLAGAYALNAAWSLAAQRDRFAVTPILLPLARRRRSPGRNDRR
jgi:hypothetical protein